MKKTIYTFLALTIIFLFGSSNFAEANQLPKVNIDLKKIVKFDGKFNFIEFIEARRGGGSRGGSFGRSRSSSRSSTRSSSRSSSRSSASLPRNPSKSPSFGGSRISKEQATAKYGVPRRTQTMASKNELGQNMNYRVNDYGGFSSSLMMGYMMGNMSWWMMGPAFFYSRPVYVENTDGSVDVYPPSFSFGKLLLALFVIVIVYYLIKGFFKPKNRSNEIKNRGSFI